MIDRRSRPLAQLKLQSASLLFYNRGPRPVIILILCVRRRRCCDVLSASLQGTNDLKVKVKFKVKLILTF